LGTIQQIHEKLERAVNRYEGKKSRTTTGSGSKKGKRDEQGNYGL
jgi:hypothetical protein